MKLTCLVLCSGFVMVLSTDHKLVSHGTKFEKFRKIVNRAIELSCHIVFDRTHTREHCLYGR